VRAVVKVEGMHQSESSERSWLPFTLRLYLYADLKSVRLVHTFIYDGEQTVELECASVKTIPSLAKRLMFGVWIFPSGFRHEASP